MPPTVSAIRRYQVQWKDRRGACHSSTGYSMSSVHQSLARLCERRIAADAYEIIGGERCRIGGTWKNGRQWTWACERE